MYEDEVCDECGEEPRYCSCEVLNMAEKVLNKQRNEEIRAIYDEIFSERKSR